MNEDDDGAPSWHEDVSDKLETILVNQKQLGWGIVILAAMVGVLLFRG